MNPSSAFSRSLLLFKYRYQISKNHNFNGVHPSVKGLVARMNAKSEDKIPNKRIFKNSTSPSTAILHVLGCGAPGLPKALYLFTDNSRYLFNCGEGTQRLAHEYKLKLSRLEHIFLTSSTWESTGGLPGVSLTLQDIGIPKIFVHGPPGLDDLYIATQKFVILNKMKIETPKCENGDLFEDATMTVKYVSLKSNPVGENNKDKQNENDPQNFYDHDDTDYYGHEITGKRHIRNSEMKELLALPEKNEFYSMCYICRLKPRLGTLDLQKCVNKGIKPGPILGLLKNGEDVTLPDGTVVYAKDVRTPDDPGPVFIVVDVPDITYLDSLLKSGEFKIHQGEAEIIDRPSVIVHFTPNVIFQNEKYQNFIRQFSSSTSHLVINDNNKCIGSMAIQRVQHQLNLLNSEIFPLLNNEINKTELTVENANSTIIDCKTLTLFKLRPNLGLDRSLEASLNIKEYIEEPLKNKEFELSIRQLHNDIDCLNLDTSNGEYPKIVFLGTGSCIPNKTRNTSGIMIHMDNEHSILFDCGEGTFGQMMRFYGLNKIDHVLKNMRAIYVSHLHADHHIGLVNILQRRKKALDRLKIENKVLYLLAPKQIMSWLYLYDKQFERILSGFKLVPNSNFIKNSEIPISQDMLERLNITNVETCYVKHCPNAFGVSITANEKKITYSGDTMPCVNLINLGKNSDILIHEATMEDDLKSEAFRKFHSTTDQALSVSRQMEARHTLLTHFSQRYARVPRLSSEMERSFKEHNVGIAFDNMEINFTNLRILPRMYSSLKLLYAEHYEELEIKAKKRALKRERAGSPPDLKAPNPKINTSECKN